MQERRRFKRSSPSPDPSVRFSRTGSSTSEGASSLEGILSPVVMLACAVSKWTDRVRCLEDDGADDVAGLLRAILDAGQKVGYVSRTRGEKSFGGDDCRVGVGGPRRKCCLKGWVHLRRVAGV